MGKKRKKKKRRENGDILSRVNEVHMKYSVCVVV